MKRTINQTGFAALLLLALFAITPAQKKPADYKIGEISITPFDGMTGKFEDKHDNDPMRTFLNELGISVLVVVEVKGEAGSYATGRNAEVVVMEGKKLKRKKVEMLGILNNDGKFFVSVWLDGPMCDEVTITARLIGQKTASKKVTKLAFACGE